MPNVRTNKDPDDDGELATRPNTPQAKENELYELWYKGDSKEKEEVLKKLIPLLIVHAAKIVWRVLRVNDNFLAEELAQDAALDLDCFQRRSAFSTWFHSRCLFKCNDERRRHRHSREVPMPPIDEIPSKSSVATVDPRKDILLSDHLTPEQQELCAMRLKYGLTIQEIAEIKGTSPMSISRKWSEVKAELRKIYGDIGE